MQASLFLVLLMELVVSRRDGSQTRRGLLPMLLDFVPKEVRPLVKAITIQEVVAAIKASDRHPWISEFERKYGLA